MKFIVSSTGLFSHLQAISRVINSKNSLPILDCFLLEMTDGTLSITASDSETTLATSIEANECDTDGRFAVNSKTILDALKAVSIPTVEVHISKVSEREPFRQISYVSYYAVKTIQGLGFEGYREGIRFLKEYLNSKS